MSNIDIIFIISAYLIGSVSTAIIVCKIMGLPDPRSEGSGNPGATNVLRVGGKKAAAITLFGDMLKGFVPVFVAHHFDLSSIGFALTGLAAFAGHLFPIFFAFKGGKGVATMLGVLFGVHWIIGAATALSWLFMAKVFKISSLSALVATLLAPVYVFIIMRLYFHQDLPNTLSLVGSTGLMTLMLFWRHRANIQRLLKGEEGRIGKSS